MYYLGIDVGSVSTDIVLLDNSLEVVQEIYLKTKGSPIKAVYEGLKQLSEKYDSKQISGVGTTGSGRAIASAITGADIIKNEITTHAIAASITDPEVQTILEIGGQDSKIIILRDGVISDFAMNTVCAAGTGSFLDRQAERLGIDIDRLGPLALKAKSPVRIAGRCAVFAESDIIHKQQLGYGEEDLMAGLCQAMVRNYMSNLAKGKEIKNKIFFQGGVAANAGIKKAFEEAIGSEVMVPKHFKVMGSVGAAVLAKEAIEKEKKKTLFKGFDILKHNITTKSFECNDCPNHCEVIMLYSNNGIIGCFSDRCGKYQDVPLENKL
ncbi:MAG: acyl-CoA dehydratase activase [Clostridia bacterium]|nr:acyl-CoA dehydratase activase [Clostridia bacterium]